MHKKTLREKVRIAALIFPLSGLLLFTLMHCHSDGIKPDSEAANEPDKAEESYQLMLWEGGGFSGLREGFTLLSDGTVTQWQDISGKSKTIQWTAAGYSAEIDHLHQELLKTKAMAGVLVASGNLTRGVMYTKNDESYTWTWDRAITANDSTKVLQYWFQQAKQFCLSCRKQE